jgi:hypothetical protein
VKQGTQGCGSAATPLLACRDVRRRASRCPVRSVGDWIRCSQRERSHRRSIRVPPCLEVGFLNLLASLLPGVRELRAPFASGLLWLATFYFAVPGAVVEFVEAPAMKSAIDALGGPAAVTTVALAGLAYVVGIAIGGVTAPLTSLLGQLLLRFMVWFGAKRIYIATDEWRGPLRQPRWFFRLVMRMELNVWPLTVAGRSLLIDALQARLSKVGVPGSASIMFPLDNVLSNLRFSAAQLASTVPSQYQEYDRLRSEVDLRVAVVPPLVALATVLPVGPKWPVVGGAIFIGVMLWVQAAQTTRAANDLLGNSAYLDQLKVPAIESLASELEKVSPKPASSGAWIAEMIMTLDRLGLFDDSEALLEEASYLDDMVDQKDVLAALPDGSFQRDRLASAAKRYEASKLAAS